MNLSPLAKTGLMGAAAGLLLAILSRNASVGWAFGPQTCPGPISWITVAGIAALYVHLSYNNKKAFTTTDGALGGATIGIIMGLVQSFISIAAIALFDMTIENPVPGTDTTGIQELAAQYRSSSASILLGVLLGSLFTIIPGAISGAVWTARKQRAAQETD